MNGYCEECEGELQQKSAINEINSQQRHIWLVVVFKNGIFVPLEILYEDHHLIAVSKPASLPTQAPAQFPSLEADVKAYIKEKLQKPAGVYLGIPHRLDRPVSGVIVFARNTKAAQRVHEQFQNRTVEKVYWAVVSGVVTPLEGEWTDWILKQPNEAKVVQAVEGQAAAKLAKLSYRVLQTILGKTLIQFHPETGRTHQLRVQSAWRGFPILGDTLYGSEETTEQLQTGEHAILLHARRLSIDHPFTRERLSWEAPLPSYWPESK